MAHCADSPAWRWEGSDPEVVSQYECVLQGLATAVLWSGRRNKMRNRARRDQPEASQEKSIPIIKLVQLQAHVKLIKCARKFSPFKNMRPSNKMHPKMQVKRILEVCQASNKYFSEFCDTLIPSFLCNFLFSSKGFPNCKSFRPYKTWIHPFRSHIFIFSKRVKWGKGEEGDN